MCGILDIDMCFFIVRNRRATYAAHCFYKKSVFKPNALDQFLLTYTSVFTIVHPRLYNYYLRTSYVPKIDATYSIICFILHITQKSQTFLNNYIKTRFVYLLRYLYVSNLLFYYLNCSFSYNKVHLCQLLTQFYMNKIVCTSYFD